MRSSHSLDGIAETFDDGHSVAGAGPILAGRAGRQLGLRQLFDDHVDWSCTRPGAKDCAGAVDRLLVRCAVPESHEDP